MLKDNGMEFTYREYKKQPLTEDELRRVLLAYEGQKSTVIGGRHEFERHIESELVDMGSMRNLF